MCKSIVRYKGHPAPSVHAPVVCFGNVFSIPVKGLLVRYVFPQGAVEYVLSFKSEFEFSV